MHARSALLATLISLGLAAAASAGDPTGIWKSAVTLNGQSFETTLSLVLDTEGPTLSGFELDRNSHHQLPIYKAACKANQIQFAVNHDSAEQKLAIRYQGTISRDNTITGTATFEFGDRSQTATWFAKRESRAGR